MQHPSVQPHDPSWWFTNALATDAAAPPCPPLRGERPVDVAIVGGGFTGLWTALALRERRPELNLCLIEAEQCGSGASGKNGGLVSGYWGYVPRLSRSLGQDAALAIARAGTRAQDAIRAFATAPGRDVWWREQGGLRVSTAAAQDARLRTVMADLRAFGADHMARLLTRDELLELCNTPTLRGGILFSEGANLHPGRLVRALRRAVIESGTAIFENTPMLRLEEGAPSRITTPEGALIARDVVLATNAALATDPGIRRHVTLFSSYAVITEPAAERIASMPWRGEQGVTDLRTFLNYARRTADGRVLAGSSAGAITYGDHISHARLTRDAAVAGRAEAALRRMLPAFADVPLAQAWGGAIDVASDRLPFFRSKPGRRVHYACGFSGHGVNAAWLAGQCLASLVLDARDEWSSLPFCTRPLPPLPPEPLRYAAGALIQWGMLACDDAEERGERAGPAARIAAALPSLFRIRMATR